VRTRLLLAIGTVSPARALGCSHGYCESAWGFTSETRGYRACSSSSPRGPKETLRRAYAMVLDRRTIFGGSTAHPPTLRNEAGGGTRVHEFRSPAANFTRGYGP